MRSIPLLSLRYALNPCCVHVEHADCLGFVCQRVDQDIEHYVRSVLQDIRSHNVLIGEPTYHLSAGGQLMTCIFPCDGEDSHLVLTK